MNVRGDASFSNEQLWMEELFYIFFSFALYFSHIRIIETSLNDLNDDVFNRLHLEKNLEDVV